MPRLIDADSLNTSVAIYMTENAYIGQSALDALKMISKWVEESPTVDVEPVRHGRWIVKGAKSRCTNCNIKSYTAMPIEDGLFYCPNCGAKMDVEVIGQLESKADEPELDTEPSGPIAQAIMRTFCSRN